MRKMKKINGFLVVKFNARELREWEGTALGNYGVMDEELYTGKLEIDRGSMEYDNIETIEEAVEMAHGLYTEEDYNEQPSTYAVVEEAGAELQLHRETEKLLAYICDEICKERIPGRTQEELDAVCAKCEVNQLAAAPTLAPPPEFRDAFQHIENGGNIAQEIYTLGLKLADDCPMNDCHLYLNIFNMCRELDEQIDRVEGWPRKLLEMEFKRKYLELKKMFMLNHAVNKYKHERAAPALMKSSREPNVLGEENQI